MHDREGAPERAIAACLLADGRRAWGTSEDADLPASVDGEWVGARHPRRSALHRRATDVVAADR